MNILDYIQGQRKLEGRTTFQGLQVSIENDKGSTRSGTNAKGEEWHTTMTWPYGYIRRTEGVDGDHVDCFIGPNPNATHAYVVHQKKCCDFKTFDEDKVMLGFDSAADAKQAFLDNYDNPKFFGQMEAIPMADFKEKVLATKDKPAKIEAAQSLIGEPVTVDGLPGRGVITAVDGRRVNVTFRNGLKVSRDVRYIHLLKADD